jgi:hypothetical protein
VKHESTTLGAETYLQWIYQHVAVNATLQQVSWLNVRRVRVSGKMHRFQGAPQPECALTMMPNCILAAVRAQPVCPYTQRTDITHPHML